MQGKSRGWYNSRIRVGDTVSILIGDLIAAVKMSPLKSVTPSISLGSAVASFAVTHLGTSMVHVFLYGPRCKLAFSLVSPEVTTTLTCTSALARLHWASDIRSSHHSDLSTSHYRSERHCTSASQSLVGLERREQANRGEAISVCGRRAWLRRGSSKQGNDEGESQMSTHIKRLVEILL